MKLIIKLSFILTIVVNACTPEEEYCAFNDVDYIDDSAKNFNLTKESEFSLPYLGALDFKIYDNLMILTNSSKEKLMTIMDKDTHNLLGEFINYGRGPGECLDVIYHSNLTIQTENGHLVGYFENSGLIYRIDITESLSNNETVISQIPGFDNHNLIMRILPLEQERFLIKEVSDEFDSQIRYIQANGERIITPSMEHLNSVRLHAKRSDYLFNILSSFVHYNQVKDIVVEVPIFLNNINLYSLNDSFSKTICLGKQLQNINQYRKPDKLIRWAKDFRGYHNYFAILDGTSDDSTILFFTYEGELLCQITLDNRCSSFDIDLSNSVLYTYNVSEEKFYLYDISDILNVLGEHDSTQF